MIIYLTILICIYMLSLVEPRKLNKLDVLYFSLLALISGFRYGVGTDFFSYIGYFDRVVAGRKIPAEPGFVIISKIAILLNLNSQFVFLVFSILTVFFLYKGIKYYTDTEYTYKPALYIIFLIFTFFPSLNGMRQALAAAIVLYASKYILEKKFTTYVFLVFIAMQFHFTSIIFIVLYFVINREHKKSILLVVLSSAFIISKLGLLNKILEYIIFNFSFLDVGGYIQNYLYSAYNTRKIGFGIVFYINLLILVLFIFFKDKINKTSKDTLIFNMFYLNVLSGVLSMGAPMFSRLTYFFSIYMALYIPKISDIFNPESKRVVEVCLLILYSILYIYVILNGYITGTTDYIPYNYNFNVFL